MAAELDLKLTGPKFWTHVRPISVLGLQRLFLENEALRCSAGKVWYPERSASRAQYATPSQQVQGVPWKRLFGKSTEWWCDGGSKSTPCLLDGEHKVARIVLWLSRRHKPSWVDWQLGMFDVTMKTSLKSSLTSAHGHGAFAAGEVHPEVIKCIKLCEEGRISDAGDALDVLVQRGCHVPNNVFYRVLKGCIKGNDLVLGTRIHALIVQGGYRGDAFLATHLIGLYASHRKLDEAMRVFTDVCTPDAYNWATIILGYARHGGPAEATEAIRLYRQMCVSTTVKPDDRIFSAVLKACAVARNLVAGREVHSHILASSAGKAHGFLQAGLVNMYAKCGSLDDARTLFDNLADRNVVAWTAMIAGYAQQGMGQEALDLYRSMQREGVTPPNSVTYVCLLQACASVGVGALCEGRKLHAEIKKQQMQEDGILGVSLVNMYAKCGCLAQARRLFEHLPERNVVAWTAMLAGYTQQGMGQEALCLYKRMQQEGLTPPDSVTFVCLLQACASVGVEALDVGKQLHAQIKEQRLQKDVVLGGSLVDMYAKCGCVEDARQVFDQLSHRNVVAWTAMLAGYAQQGFGQEALTLYSRMRQEGTSCADASTYVCLLQACAAVAALPLGEQLHAAIVEQGMQSNGIVGAALVNMYAKCGSMHRSQQVFDSLPERSIEAWGALVSGYARQGDDQIVFDLFDKMKLHGVPPNHATFLSLLTVCSHVGLVDKGREYFKMMTSDYGISATVEHFVCMVDLLGRAGHLSEALQMARTMPFPSNDAVWHTVLGACQKWKNVDIGQQAFEVAVSMNEKDVASYVLMSNIYASAQMWEAATELQMVPRKQPHTTLDDAKETAVSCRAGVLLKLPASRGTLQFQDHLRFPIDKRRSVMLQSKEGTRDNHEGQKNGVLATNDCGRRANPCKDVPNGLHTVIPTRSLKKGHTIFCLASFAWN